MHRKIPERLLRDFPISKSLAEFRRRSGERKSNHFLRRHARRGKYFSGCKCGICAPAAHKLCAQQTAGLFVGKQDVFRQPKDPGAAAPGFFVVFSG